MLARGAAFEMALGPGRHNLTGAPMEQRYELIEVIGTGGMATVHRAHDKVLGRDVAVKRLLPHLAEDPAAAARFSREAQASARLSHPGIVTVFDSGEDDEGPFIVMELIEGETLAERLASVDRLSVPEAAGIVGGAAAALDHAHGEGVVHCDIKPSNLILDSSGRIRLMDFGIAKAVDDATRVTSTGELVGTISYMAPEVVAGETATPASDIYALGAVAYEMLTGHPPFAAENVPALLTKIASDEPDELGGYVSPEVAAGIMAALAKDPADRPATAESLAMAMRTGVTMPITQADVIPPVETVKPVDWAVDEPTLVYAAEPARENTKRRNRFPLVLTGAAILVLFFALAFGRDAPAVTSLTTTTAPSTSTSSSSTTSTTLLETPEEILGVIAGVMEGMNPPEFKRKDIRDLEKRFEEIVERAEDDDRDDERLAETLQKALDDVLELPESEETTELLDLLVLLIEAYGFELDEEAMEVRD